ncbi:iron-containing alcohol dehydrogenase [Aeromonas veronii]|uniref:Iron-containing alcohol dehydrogenase n=1 Tax=Aeromonas veronii TaxID=654 RepID=A0A4V3Z0C9_AERVE|nr:iron-containing alcohol dehydrogenase [Aeromonas veronii]THJ46112.1 iron-containing alcohol dehydrogenase [Aeromonas veronii]
MATFKFYIPAINLMGAGCLQEAAADIKGYGYRKALCSPPRKMKNAFAKNENTPQR